MPWFKVDDSFYDHPKVFDAPDCVVALWTRAGAWSARNLTDGFVPAKLPARLCDDHETAVRELSDRGLWRRTKGGYQFHNWQEFQPTKKEVETEREKWRAKKAAQRQAKSGKPEPPRSPPDVSPGDTTGDSRETHPESPPESPGRVGTGSLPSPQDPFREGELRGSTRARKDPPPPNTDQNERPPERCPQHTNDPDPPNCGQCADARRASQRWDQQAETRQQQLADWLKAARNDPRNRCEHGNEAGLVTHPDTGESAGCAVCRRHQQEAS